MYKHMNIDISMNNNKILILIGLLGMLGMLGMLALLVLLGMLYKVGYNYFLFLFSFISVIR